MSDGGESSRLVQVGRVRRAHGMHGVLAVETLHAGAEEVLVPGRRVFADKLHAPDDDAAVALTIEMAEPFKGGLRVQFEEIQDRESADAWRGRYLLVPADELPERDDESIDPADLVGLEVYLTSGGLVGTVESYYELRHDLLIEVARDAGAVLVPFRPEFVESVDVESGRIVINPPEGLL